MEQCMVSCGLLKKLGTCVLNNDSSMVLSLIIHRDKS